MVVIEGMPYYISIVYLKIAGNKDIVSIPLCEALAIFTNIIYDYHESKAVSTQMNGTHYVFIADMENEKNKKYIVSKADVVKRLERDIYDNTSKIADMAIQPEDERMVDEVKQLIGI